MFADTQPLVQPAEHIQELPLLPFKIQNSLASHPLFEPERIKKLLATVPRQKIEVRRVLRKDQDGLYLSNQSAQ